MRVIRSVRRNDVVAVVGTAVEPASDALDVLEPVEDSSPRRYRVNPDSELLDLLHRVNGTVNGHLSP